MWGKRLFLKLKIIAPRRFPLILKLESDSSDFEENKVIYDDKAEFGKLRRKLNIGKITYLLVSAKREHQIDKFNIELNIDGNNFLCNSINLKNCIVEQFFKLVLIIFYEGVDYLNLNNEIFAEKYFSLSLLTNPKNTDSLEALGVIFGRGKKI